MSEIGRAITRRLHNKFSYMRRVSDKTLMNKLKSNGAVLIEGAKWCGKTTSAEQIAKSILYMQDPEKIQQNMNLADIKPLKLLQGKVPRLIDEWQMAPQLWDAIRFIVDQRNDFGQFILTGSSVPADMSKIYHSGVGRISKMLMRPMSLFESGESTGTVSLERLFSESNCDIDGDSHLDIEELAFLICRGGWPKTIGCPHEIALRQAIDYYNVVIDTDISMVDNVNRTRDRADRLMRSYARLTGTQANLRNICQDIDINEAYSLSEGTAASYINALKNIFVIEDSSAWNPNLRSKTAIRTSDTRYFSDPSIGTAALGVGPGDLVNDLKTMGLFFENLCIRDLRIYTEALDGRVYHYRDKNGLECDAVIHLPNSSYGLVEIKLGGAARIEEGIATLEKLSSNIDKTRMKSPTFKMILTGTEPYAYRRKDGILIVPIGCLGA